MEKQKIADTILRMIEDDLIQFIDSEGKIDCPIEYENRVLELAYEFGRAVIKGTSGKIPKDRNKKNRLYFK